MNLLVFLTSCLLLAHGFYASSTSVTRLTDLPKELLFRIADTPGLSIQDLANLQLSSSALKEIYNLSSAKVAYEKYGINVGKPYTVMRAYFAAVDSMNETREVDTFFETMSVFPLKQYHSETFRKPFLKSLLFKVIRVGNSMYLKRLLQEDRVDYMNILIAHAKINERDTIVDLLQRLSDYKIHIEENLVQDMTEKQHAFIQHHYCPLFVARNCTAFKERFESIYSSGVVDINDYKLHDPNIHYQFMFGAYHAIECGDTEFMKSLIDRGADLSVPAGVLYYSGQTGTTAAFLSMVSAAIVFNQMGIFEYLVDKGLSFLSDEYLDYALLALQNPFDERVFPLLKKVPFESIKKGMGWYFVQYFSSGNTVQLYHLFELLLSARPVGQLDDFFDTLNEGQQTKLRGFLNYVADHQYLTRQPSLYHLAVKSKNPIYIRFLKKTDVFSINDRFDNEPEFAICKTITSELFEMTLVLLEQGADPNTPCLDGRLLFIAIKEGLVDHVKMIVEFGANVGFVDEEGRSPLLVAMIHAQVEIVQVILDKLTTPLSNEEMLDHLYTTIRQSEADKERLVELARHLISAGYDLNGNTRSGISIAGYYGFLETKRQVGYFQALVEEGLIRVEDDQEGILQSVGDGDEEGDNLAQFLYKDGGDDDFLQLEDLGSSNDWATPADLFTEGRS